MDLADAKIVLTGLLSSEVSDSIIKTYMVKDSLQRKTIELNVSEIRILQTKLNIKKNQVDNLNRIISNKDTEVDSLNKTIEARDAEIKKQKLIKTLALIGDVVLPILAILIVTSIN